MLRLKLSILLATLLVSAFIEPHLLAQNAAQPAKSSKVTDVGELLSCIPKEFQSGLRSGSADTISKATTILNDNIRKKDVVLDFRFVSIEKFFEAGGDKVQSIRLSTAFEKARANGTGFSYTLTIFLPASALDRASKLRRNDRVRISGFIRGASINKANSGPLVIIGVECSNLE